MSSQSDYEKGLRDGARHREGSSRGALSSIMGPLLAFGLPLGIVYYVMRRNPVKGLGGGMQDMMEMMMPIKKRQFKVDVKGTSFKDVVGIPEAKDEIRQYVDFLKNPKRYTRLGARLPKGCLLTGEPGTGKTLLAKAVAGEADVPFFSCNGADFIELVGGSGPKRVRELFEEARGAAPCIVFIDEIDAVGSRASGEGTVRGGGVSGEENRTINQLLAELDGLSTSADTVIVLAATNLQDNIDKALLREGRFDRKIPIEMPDRNARVEVFTHYLGTVCTGDAKGRTTTDKGDAIPTDPAISNEELSRLLADLTPGISPATIAAIVNEAALTAATEGKKLVARDDLLSSIDNSLLGKKQRNRMSDQGTRRTAIHESGHALAAWLLPQQKDVAKISVEPRGNAMGYTQRLGSEFHEYQTNVTLFTDMVVLLGGRAAEDVILGEASVGAVDDLQKCTDVAMKQMMAFGMSPERAGLLAYHPQSTGAGRSFVSYSEGTQQLAETEARAIVEAAYQHAVKLMRDNKEKIVSMGDKLVEAKEVRTEQIRAMWGPRPNAPTVQDLVELLAKGNAAHA